MNISEIDIVFISYDEPNAEYNWADLKSKVPWALRVHGVKGFDNAHKAAAKKTNKDYIITVDGDNIIDESFLEEEVHLSNSSVISYSGKNHINGLVYGNGGIKIWPRQLLLDMRTHENSSNEKNRVDFCWDINYFQMNNVYSTVVNNASAFQAFRAGFREGVKMSLDQGGRLNIWEKHRIYPKNLTRLLIWMTIGRDVPNGEWAILGARLGCYKTFLDSSFDITEINDYESLLGIFNNSSLTSNDDLREQLNHMGFDITEFDKSQSAFFKKNSTPPLRVHPMIPQSFIDEWIDSNINRHKG